MSAHRNLRVAEAIREVVSSAILFEVSDPRVTGITVLRSEVTSDLRNATVYVSIMGTPAEQSLAMKGLEKRLGIPPGEGGRPAPDPHDSPPDVQARHWHQAVDRDVEADRRRPRS